MKLGLLDLICCPACHGMLHLAEREECDSEIENGRLACSSCGQQYPIKAGMPHLYVNDDRWAPKAREAAGWVTYHQELGIYEQGEDAVDLQVPYFPEEPWSRVAPSFDLALETLALDGSETILDLGAGRGWASKHFALRGCRVVALDVADDANVGLGRGRVLMQHANTYFERIIGDGEQLPFSPGSFDIVFCAAALHHTSNLELFLRNVATVLRPDGLLCAINEPTISILMSERKALETSSDELRHGINETRPDLDGYLTSLAAAGFSVVEASSPYLKAMSLEELRAYASARGTVWAWPGLRAPVRELRRLYYYVGMRVYGLLRRVWPRSVIRAASDRERLEQSVMLWIGGELFLLARKP
ncbi:MAG: methyltransferase domain-containing protein [Anaerolineae bacterium]|nr:methyltransferase domain-containing protein [Anaerolineae bacterium]